MRNKIMIYIGDNKYINQDDIIGVFDLNTIKDNKLLFKHKNIMNIHPENTKSYIYCKNDMLIGIPMTSAFIRKEIEKNLKLLYTEFLS